MIDWKSLTQIVWLFVAVHFSPLSHAEVIWIDVRSQAEYDVDNIEGDIRITHDNIVQGVSDISLEKNATIYLYCRSGRRAGIAMLALQEAGYTQVSNKGGMSDVREARGLIE
ncbi:rhodanese-like domain-containing protein [uncultured Shewanella sp.]|uniref:rhodanese-like domain-containing protein n=1 Tax=uncultured Shewanella sp. TaxID=173975 RepID=UPI0026300D85|nr:rhodanese-like domain-containing protein [uncultured Shewanella sp.]